MRTRKAPATHYRIVQAGRVCFSGDRLFMKLRGQFVGTVGCVPCFDGVRFLDYADRRRGRDFTPEYFRGPCTIEVLTPSGEVIGRIGLATAADVAEHPRGELAYA